MPHHEDKYCPRCQERFECKVGNITECQCTGISFSDPEKDYVATRYADCLCRKCLLEIKREFRLQQYQQSSTTILAPYQGRHNATGDKADI